jgi:hypothetical protein
MPTSKCLFAVSACLTLLFAVSCKMMTDLVPQELGQDAAQAAKEPALPAPPAVEAPAPPPAEPSPEPATVGQWPEGERFDSTPPQPKPVNPAVGIGGGVEDVAPPEASRTAEGAQTPVPPLTPAQDEMLKIIKAAADTPESQKLVEATLQALADKPDKAIALLNEYGSAAPPEKKMFAQMLKAYVDMKLGNMEDALKTMDEMHRTLREQMPLTIASPKLCRKVESFGKYDEFGHYVFPPGKALILYFEPQYFICKPVGEQFEVTLNARYLILDKDGNQVWQAEDTIDHKTTHYLYDLFMTKKIVIPSLADGNYTLKILLQDVNKTDQDKPIETEVKVEVRHDIQ